MLCGKNVPLFGCGHMSIDFRNINGAVAQHFLNIPDIYIRLQQAGGEGMAEHMRGDM